MTLDAKFTEDEHIIGGNFGVLTRGEKGDKGDKGDPFTYEDFTQEQLADLRSTVNNSASGSNILLTDSRNLPLAGLKVYGKSTQDGTPTPESPVEIISAGMGTKIEYDGNLYDDTKPYGSTELYEIFIPKNTPFTVGVHSTAGDTQFNVCFVLEGAIDKHTETIDDYVANGWATKNFTFANTVKAIKFYNVEEGTNRVVDKIMVCYGTYEITDANYQPYPADAPTPDELRALYASSGSVEVKVCGKNLADVWGIYGTEWATKKENSIEVVSIEKNTLVVKVVDNIHAIRIPTIKPIAYYSVCWTISGANKEWFYRVTNEKGAVIGIQKTSGEKDSYEAIDSPFHHIQIECDEYIPKNQEITITGYINEGWEIYEQTPYVKPQTLTLATPNELRSVPVNNDYTGDYILENGKRRICDYIDLEKGVRVERTWSATTDSATTWDLSGSTSERIEVKCWLTEYYSDDTTRGGYSNLLPYQGTTTDKNNFFNVGYTGIYVSFDGKYFGGTIPTLEEVRAFLKENPITIYTHRKTPIETPLTAEELAYYKALHTNYPNTTIFNSDGTNMDVSYIADTKLYIDNKFAELQALALEG